MRRNLTGEVELTCAHCGHAVGETAPICPHCGRVLPSEQYIRQPGDRVYLMLVTANVLRLRRQWELAEAKVSEVLRQDPENAGAYSVLGDISRDRGRLADAIQWYKMALQYNPGSAPDRKKLEAVIDEVFSRGRRGLMDKSRTAFNHWLDALTGEMRAARQLSPIALIVGGVLGILFLTALFAIATGRGQPPAPAEIPSGTPSGSFEAAPVALVAPQEKLEEVPAADGTLDEFADDLVSVETELLHRLRERASALDPNARVASVEIDPAEGAATIKLSMPRWWLVGATRRDMLRVAGSLAALAAGGDRRISKVRARCDMRQQGMPDRLAMVAEGTSQQLAKLQERAEVPPEAAFSSLWWHPELRVDGSSEALHGR